MYHIVQLKTGEVVEGPEMADTTELKRDVGGKRFDYLPISVWAIDGDLQHQPFYLRIGKDQIANWEVVD